MKDQILFHPTNPLTSMIRYCGALRVPKPFIISLFLSIVPGMTFEERHNNSLFLHVLILVLSHLDHLICSFFTANAKPCIPAMCCLAWFSPVPLVNLFMMTTRPISLYSGINNNDNKFNNNNKSLLIQNLLSINCYFYNI
jgi:hypothetical protein